jgi:hypothetical protein
MVLLFRGGRLERGAWFSHGTPVPCSSAEICVNRATHILYPLQQQRAVTRHRRPELKHYKFWKFRIDSELSFSMTEVTPVNYSAVYTGRIEVYLPEMPLLLLSA